MSLKIAAAGAQKASWFLPHHLGPSALEAGNSFIVGERSVLKEGENGTELN